jgi:dolichol-phosphate mannosyltransferase
MAMEQQKIICVIPTLNEHGTIERVVRNAKRYTDHVVVVDGFSQDETFKRACEAGAEVIYQDGAGKGMALRTAFQKFKGEVFVTIDGDGTYDPLEMDRLLQPVLNGEADLVIGSRFAGKREDGSISLFNQFGNRLFNLMINLRFRGKLTDSQSGYRVLSRRAVEVMGLTSQGFEIETEMTIKALKLGLTVVEVPINYYRRRGSLSKLNSFLAGRKILTTILHG